MRVNHVEYDENLYTYDELSEEAKEVVKQWYLDDDWRTENFTEMVDENLSELFPHSDLKVEYSLAYSQGDGLNIYGHLYMDDFLPYYQATKEAKATIAKYIEQLDYYDEAWVEFSQNRRYGYSMKFIDAKDIEWLVGVAEDTLTIEEYIGHPEIVDTKLLEDFYSQIFDYFKNLDKEYEEMGYEYLYEADDEEVAEHCEANGYEFYEDGRFAG